MCLWQLSLFVEMIEKIFSLETAFGIIHGKIYEKSEKLADPIVSM